ncbi:uncharacterized protein Triagg1_7902 [Trichoderma aggressivum f. europaeum]|uniref:Uncharacterized protein n=1 Tax=Trichoderma aggressivum f. europaeum TaxID=173218 RepID=A0AAE1IBH3_9HYPO|nr:hypothetical protein Triagg1_7902 [Trichoderma aggressivum f. europaeum]
MAEDASGNLQAAHDLFGPGVVRTQVVDMDSTRCPPITSTSTRITVPRQLGSAPYQHLPTHPDLLTASPHNKDGRQSDAEGSGSTGATICQDALRSLTNVTRMAKTAASWGRQSLTCTSQSESQSVDAVGGPKYLLVGLLLLDDETRLETGDWNPVAHPVARLLDDPKWLRLRDLALFR